MKEINTEELLELRESKKKHILLDTRSKHYFNWEQIPGAINLRWKYLEKNFHHQGYDKDTLIITHCQSFLCTASTKAYKILESMGYNNLLEYSGGIEEWKTFGNKVEINEKYRISNRAYKFPDQKFYSSNVGSYLIEEEDFILLVDGPQKIDEEIEDFILSFDKAIKIFLTHGPTGGETPLLQKKFDARIYLHAADKDNEWLNHKIDNYFSNNFDFSKTLKVFHTPGHSPGSSVLIDTKHYMLFSGDSLSNKNNQIFNFLKKDTHSDNVIEQLNSLKNLSKNFDFNSVFPFHYEPILHKGKEKLLKYFQRSK